MQPIARTQDQGGAWPLVQRAGAAARLRHAVESAGLSDALDQVRREVMQMASRGPCPASTAARHLVSAGGKAVRPLLTLLCAQAVGGKADPAIPCAVAGELIHDATLLHDDVIDDGCERRGVETPRVLWGNTVSVLSGDLLFVAALQAVGSHGPSAALSELLEAVGRMVEGEVLQFRHRGRLDLDLGTYEQIVERKTAALFRWCARAGALAGGGGDEEIEALGRYGRHVGIAFQIRDDVLDLTADPAQLGKALGADLAEGKLTLPLLLALEVRPALATDLERAARSAGRPDLPAIGRIARVVRDTGSLDAARERMHRELAQALGALPRLAPSPAVRLLAAVAEMVGDRDR